MGECIDVMLDNLKKCVTCGFPLSETFPDDFPDEFKFCCGCLKYAEILTKHNFKNGLYTERLIRIYNAIRLS